MSEEVVLVPGLWMPVAAIRVLERRLARKGYAVHHFAYAGRSTFDGNLRHFASHVRHAMGGRAAHFVGHSLGGVLMLQALRDPSLPVASALLLGAPVRGCLAGRRLASHRVGRWMMGGSVGCWSQREATWRRAEPLGVIAGTAPVGLGRLLGRLPGESDGVVCVEETGVDGMTARALVPMGHSMLIFSQRVATLVERFLRDGRFE